MSSIIITGAGSGIGRLTARKFLAMGWQVGLIGRREAALVEAAEGHENALVLPCDVTDVAQVDAAFDKAAATFGRIDALFNNAGATLPATMIDEVAAEDWMMILGVNISGMFLCARAAFRHMRRQSPQGGRIINNGSISAHVPRYGSSPYTTTKHAVTGLTRSLSLDGRQFNIACSQIDIGNALTDMAVAMTKGVPQADGSMAVEPVMEASHVADQIAQMADLPLHVNVQFVTLMASHMPFVGRG